MAEGQNLRQSEAEELKEGQEHPGKVPGEGAGPAEAAPGATDSRGGDLTSADPAEGGGNAPAPAPAPATGTTPTEGGG
jgi:hypothetical protein